MTSQCTGLEKAGSGCTPPESDPILFELNKGANPRYYQYKNTKIRQDRVRQRQNYMRECVADSSKCFMEEIQQSLTSQPMYDENGTRISSNLNVSMRLKDDFPAAYPEGEIEESMRIVDTLRGQRHDRQCNLHGTMCGDESLVRAKPDLPTAVVGAYGNVRMVAK